jgi:hypothetical protein
MRLLPLRPERSDAAAREPGVNRTSIDRLIRKHDS